MVDVPIFSPSGLDAGFPLSTEDLTLAWSASDRHGESSQGGEVDHALLVSSMHPHENPFARRTFHSTWSTLSEPDPPLSLPNNVARTYDGSPRPRKRAKRLLPERSKKILLQAFAEDPYPGAESIRSLARELELAPWQIHAWFNSRRHRHIPGDHMYSTEVPPERTSLNTNGFSQALAEPPSSEDVVTRQFADMLSRHTSLRPLIREGLRTGTVGVDEFWNNLKNLMMIYAGDLQSEAREDCQLIVANLVYRNKMTISDLIREEYSGIEDTRAEKRESQRFPERHFSGEEPPNEDDKSGKYDRVTSQHGSVETLAPVREFLLESKAFENLKASFEEIVKQLKTPEMLESDTPLRCVAPYRRNAFGIFTSLLARFRLVEFPLEPGKTRVRWKCRCGRQLYDDYVEMKPGALKELQTRLDQFSNSGTGGFRNGDGASTTASSTGRSFSTALNWLAGFTGATRKKSASPCIPMHNTTATGAFHLPPASTPQQDSLYLLMCMRDGEHATSLHQGDVCELKNDRQLFQFLHKEYRYRRRKLSSLVSLRAPEAINLIKFRLAFGKYVEVFAHRLNCTSGAECACLPPPEPDAEYRCAPIPAGLCPPIGPALLMHCFNEPGCLRDETQSWMLAQFPKKLHGELTGKSAGPVEGWGVHFREGWNWDRVGWLLAAYVLGSSVFGVAWWAAREDVQGASGVAGYLASTATVFLGWIATRRV